MRKSNAELAPVEDVEDIEVAQEAEVVKEVPLSRQERGEQALEDAFYRAETFVKRGMEKAAPLLNGIRSRISNFATRAMKTLAVSVGFAGETKDAAVALPGKAKDVAKKGADIVATRSVSGIESVASRAAEKAMPAAEAIANADARYLAAAEIASQALSQILGREVHLSHAAAIVFGAALDAEGLAERFASKALHGASDLLVLDDVVDTIKGNGQALRAMYAAIANPESRAAIIEALNQADIDAGAAIEEAARAVAGEAWNVTKKTGKAGLKIGAGVAAVAATPVVLPIAAVGAVGYGAVQGALRAGEAANDAWNTLEPEVRNRINIAVEGAKRDWAKVKPGIGEGIAATVAPAFALGEMLYETPGQMKAEVEEGIIKMNEIAAQAVDTTERAQKRVASAMDIARTAWNNIRIALFGEKVKKENAKLVEDITLAADMSLEINQLPLLTPEEKAQPPQRRQRPAPRAVPVVKVAGING